MNIFSNISIQNHNLHPDLPTNAFISPLAKRRSVGWLRKAESDVLCCVVFIVVFLRVRDFDEQKPLLNRLDRSMHIFTFDIYNQSLWTQLFFEQKMIEPHTS